MTRPVSGSLLGSSDPALRAVVVEDAAAIVGLGLAALGLLRSGTLESSVPDAIASIMIGILLAVTAFGLARPVADLLVGRALPANRLAELAAILASDAAVDEMLTLRAVYTGPREVIVLGRFGGRRASKEVNPLRTVMIWRLMRANRAQNPPTDDAG